MVIINPQVATQPAAFNRPAGPAPVLPTDRVLMAVVMSQKASHLYELASGGLKMMAESQTPLRQGEQLQLRVTGHDASQRPQLEILSRNSVQLLPLIKASLPQQQNLNQLSSNLIANFKLSPNPQVQQASEQFIAALPQREQLTSAAALKNVIANSGLFLEAHLAKGEPIAGDIKTALLKLARQLENASQQRGELQKHLQGRTSSGNEGLSKNYQPAQNSPLPQASQNSPGQPPQTQQTAGKPALPGQAAGSGQAQPGASPSSSQAPLNSSAASSALPPSSLPKAAQQTNGNRAASAYQASSNAVITGANEQLPGDLRAQARIPINQAEILRQPEQANQLLLNMAKGVIARHEAHQLLHLQTADPLQQQYMMEIPVRDRDGIDVWQMQIERRHQQQESENAASQDKKQARHQWNITLNFDFPGMGPVKAVVRHSDKQMRVDFTAEQPRTEAAIRQFQSELSQRLSEQGIADVVLQSRVGDSRGPSSALHRQHLLEDQA